MSRFAFLGVLAVSLSVSAQQPPTTALGGVGNETLVANKDVANAQAVGIITKFMSEGSQTCDAEGKNCRGLFGANDSFDFTTAQKQVQHTTGIQAFSFMDGEDSSSIAAQTSTLVLACADRAVKTLSGIAFKALGCQVNTEGDVELQYQVCSAPSRGNPVTQPDNAVWCSPDPAHPSYRPPAGKVCLRAACDTEPVNSLNGWSSPQTVTWEANLPASASETQRTNNGLGLTFYPPLNGSVPPSFKAGSDNMTAVKVVESYLNSTTNQSAVALRVAFRHKATVTKEMLTSGSASVPDPSAHTAHWDTLLKLQDNPLIPQYQQKFAQNGSECLQQIQSGISKDGKITVCDPDFVGESGVRPIQKTAQVAAQGQACATTSQCLEEVVNTNTWNATCLADVPLAMRNCSTTQDYQMVDIHATRKRSQDICREKRTTAEYSCSTTAVVETVLPYWDPISALSANGSTAAQTVLKYERRFLAPIGATVVGARISSIHADNWMEIRLNGTRVWASLDGNLNTVKDGDTYNNCNNETWTETRYDWDGAPYLHTESGVRCLQATGTKVRANYSDACIWHCTWDDDYAVNVPITVSLVKPSQMNIIEVACFNNRGPSACNFQMDLQYLPWEAFKVINECHSYEAAA